MSLLWTPPEHSFEENTYWARLRAIEWKALPAFVSQPIVPILLLRFAWYEVVIGIILAAFIWIPVRWRSVSIPVASASAIFVAFLKWPVAIAMGALFLYKGMWLNSLISFLWPFLVIVVQFPYAGSSKGLGDYEVRFMQKMGYDISELSQ